MSDRFAGTWRLVSFAGRGADGRETAPYGPTPRGYLMYDGRGRMSAQIAHADARPLPGNDPRRASPEEIRDAFDRYFGYFGTYDVDESAATVTHHIEGASFPNWIGTDQRRFFTREGDRLVLATPASSGEAGMTYVAEWERLS